MVSRKHYYHSIQRQSRCKDHIYVLDTIRAAGMDETYGTYVHDECFDIRDYVDGTDHDNDDDTGDGTDDGTNGDTDDDTDDGGRRNRRPLPGGAVHFSPHPGPPPGGWQVSSVRLLQSSPYVLLPSDTEK